MILNRYWPKFYQESNTKATYENHSAARPDFSQDLDQFVALVELGHLEWRQRNKQQPSNMLFFKKLII